MAFAAIASIFYGAEYLFSTIATLIEVGEITGLGGLAEETAFAFGEGELALFSDFGADSYELGQSIKSGAETIASAANRAGQAVKTVDNIHKAITSTDEQPAQ